MYKLDLSLDIYKAKTKDTCILCGDVVDKEVLVITSNSHKGFPLKFDIDCFDQLLLLGYKWMSTLTERTNN